MAADIGNGEAHVQTAALAMPALGADSGGDFRLVRDSESKTIALVGDVAGNGPDAAPYADRLCHELESFDSTDPVDLLAGLNSRIHADPGFDRFATACAVVIDRDSWSARWAFAGHLPPHWLDTGLPLDGATPGLPLGVEQSFRGTSAERRPLRPDEGMLLFTDGLEDVKGPGGDRFGSARITHTLALRLNGASVDEVVSTLKDIACDFGNGELPDDLCLLALRVV